MPKIAAMEQECPLCMEPFEIDDFAFIPCKCRYQVCRFCWHRLQTDGNGLCPACRRAYPEIPVNFKPFSASDVKKIRAEKKQKELQEKIKIADSRRLLSSQRILQKNLVYVVGLSARVADANLLKKFSYFGKYGRIIKIVVGSVNSRGSRPSSFSAHVTYARYEDALKAIQGVNNAYLDGRMVRACLGTNKYCWSFLRNQPCHKPECMYLHDMADNELCFTKDDMQLGRHTEYERKLIESTFPKERRPSQSRSYRPLPAPTHPLCENACASQKSSVKQNPSKSVAEQDESEVRAAASLGKEGFSKNFRVGGVFNGNLPDDSSFSNPGDRYGGHVPNTVMQERMSDSERSSPSPYARMPLAELYMSPEENVLKRNYGQSVDVFHRTHQNSDELENSIVFDEVLKKAGGTVSENEPQKRSSLRYVDFVNLLDSPAPMQTNSNAELQNLAARSDDDLEFDPYSESAKGLASLLEEEQKIATSFDFRFPGDNSSTCVFPPSTSQPSDRSPFNFRYTREESADDDGRSCTVPLTDVESVDVGKADHSIPSPSSNTANLVSEFNPFGCLHSLARNPSTSFSSSLLQKPLECSVAFSPSAQNPFSFLTIQSTAPSQFAYDSRLLSRQPSPLVAPTSERSTLMSRTNGPDVSTMRSLASPQPRNLSGCATASLAKDSEVSTVMAAPGEWPLVPPFATSAIDGSEARKIWQDEFKELLPTINVRFMSDITSAGLPAWNRSSLLPHESPYLNGTPQQPHPKRQLPPSDNSRGPGASNVNSTSSSSSFMGLSFSPFAKLS